MLACRNDSSSRTIPSDKHSVSSAAIFSELMHLYGTYLKWITRLTAIRFNIIFFKLFYFSFQNTNSFHLYLLIEWNQFYDGGGGVVIVDANESNANKKKTMKTLSDQHDIFIQYLALKFCKLIQVPRVNFISSGKSVFKFSVSISKSAGFASVSFGFMVSHSRKISVFIWWGWLGLYGNSKLVAFTIRRFKSSKLKIFGIAPFVFHSFSCGEMHAESGTIGQGFSFHILVPEGKILIASLIVYIVWKSSGFSQYNFSEIVKGLVFGEIDALKIATASE